MSWAAKQNKFAVAGDRTRVTRVTGGNTYHYTTTTSWLFNAQLSILRSADYPQNVLHCRGSVFVRAPHHADCMLRSKSSLVSPMSERDSTEVLTQLAQERGDTHIISIKHREKQWFQKQAERGSSGTERRTSLGVTSRLKLTVAAFGGQYSSLTA